MAIKIKRSAYSGEVLERLLVRATTSNELVSGGHIKIQPNVTKKFTIPRLKASKMLQKYKEMPDWKKDAKGDFLYDEVYLRPKEVMAFTVFNPRTFEHIWRPFQPQGNLVFAKLPANVQNQLLDEMAKVVDMELGYHFINGKYSDKEGDFFNGILTRILMNKAVQRLKATPITEKNILATSKSVKAAIPTPILKHKNLKIFMSRRDFESYDAVITDKPYKGEDYTNMNPERYKGIRIVVLPDWPDDVIVATHSSMEMDSNFWAGVSLKNDANVVQIDKVENAGELYFFKMLMKIDTQVVFGEDIVLYDARKDVEVPDPNDEDDDDDDDDDDDQTGGNPGPDPEPDPNEGGNG